MNTRCSAVFFYVFCLLSVQGISSAEVPQVEVIAESAKVKVNQETIAVAKKGQKYRLLKTQGAWIAIQLGDEDKARRGWILASDVKRVPDTSITDETPAPSEPIDVRVAIDLTQFSPPWGAQSSMYFKIRIENESADPIELKIADLDLKVDDQPLPPVVTQPGNFNGYPVFADPSMRVQLQPGTLTFLKDGKLAAGGTAEGWLGFNLSSLQQLLFQPGALSGKSWIVEGKVGPHPIRFDLKTAEIGLIAEKARPSKLDASVKVIEIGPRINAINATKVLELLRTVPADDRGCVLVLKNKECLFDGLATQHFQQQMYQIFPSGNSPVASNEGAQPLGPIFGQQGFFSYGQVPIVASEAAAVLTILGRRQNSGATLIKHLDDEAADTRAAAARALTQHLAEANVIAALAKSSADADPAVRMAAVGALGGGGQPTKSGMRKDGSVDTVALIKAMTDPIPGVRMTAAQTAAVFPCDTVRAALVLLLDEADFSVKLAATASVGTLQAIDSVPKLKVLQTDPNPQMKTAAIDALIKIGELTPLAGALAKLDGGQLQDADFKVLGQAREKKAVEPLIALLKTNNNYQVNLVARTLGEIRDPRAVEPLIQIFEFGNRNFGMDELPRALGRLGDSRAIAPLRQALKPQNQFLQQDLRASICEGLLLLKAPKAMEEIADEMQKLATNNRHFEINPLLQALGRSRDAKAIPIIEPYLSNQQSCMAAAEALLQLGTKASYAALENRLTAADFQNAQMIIMNRRWPQTATAVGFLKRVGEGKNQMARMAATNALNNLQPTTSNNGIAAFAPVPVGYFAPALEADNAVEEWINGQAATADDLRGKVVVILLPDTAGAAPDLPVEGSKCLEKYESQGLIVLALWKYAGWDWDAAAKGMVIRTDATSRQEQRAVAAFSKFRDVKYRVGLVSTVSGLTEKFGGPNGPRVAVVDRAGILQDVRAVEEGALEAPDFESLIAELIAEPSPSASAVRIPRQISPPPDVPKLPRSAVLAYSATSFDPVAESLTIPAHHDTIWSAKFAPDGKTIATTSGDGTARIWDLTTGKLRHTLSGHEGIVRHCTFSNDGLQLFTSGFDRTIRVWDATSGELQRTLTDDVSVYFLAPLDDSRTLIAASQDTRVRYWNLRDGKIEGYMNGHSGTAWTAASAKGTDGNSIIVSGSVDRTVRVWDFPSGETRHTLSGHQQGVNAVAVSTDAQTVASGSGEVILWNALTGETKHKLSLPGSFVYDLAFSPDQKTLAVGRSNHTVSLYDVESGQLTRRWNRGGWCVHFSKDGKYLATGCDDRTVRIWKVAGGSAK